MNPVEELKRSVNLLSTAVRFFKEEPDLLKAEKKDFSDFRMNKAEYYKNVIKQAPDRIKGFLYKIQPDDPTSDNALARSLESANMLTRACLSTNIASIDKTLDDLSTHVARFQVEAPMQNGQTTLQVPLTRIPGAIRSEIKADMDEIMRCFSSGCLRSTVILCGRVLETCLHRKYYEVTGNDILETNPGIGLGKLIAKLKENNIGFDPGITEQIHLINQVRIYSVHKSQLPFVPSKNQAQAMVLYTVDVLKKMFD